MSKNKTKPCWKARGPKGSRRTMRAAQDRDGGPGIRAKAVVTGKAYSAAQDLTFYIGPRSRSWKDNSKARRPWLAA